MTESLFAWFVMLVWIAAGAKSAPMIIRGVAPVVRPLGPPIVVAARHFRLPFACVMAVSVLFALATVGGALYGYFIVSQPRTCAVVPALGTSVPTCEIGHPYHQELQGLQP